MSAPPRVLLVEDSPLAAEALALLLDVAGYAVDAVGTVADAVARGTGTEAPYAALLLDLTLPDGDGLEVARALAAAARLPAATLALTGHDDAATAERCLAAGCAAVLTKPVASARLLAALRDAGATP